MLPQGPNAPARALRNFGRTLRFPRLLHARELSGLMRVSDTTVGSVQVPQVDAPLKLHLSRRFELSAELRGRFGKNQSEPREASAGFSVLTDRTIAFDMRKTEAE